MGTIGGNHRAMEPMAARRGVTGRAAQRMRAAVPVAGMRKRFCSARTARTVPLPYWPSTAMARPRRRSSRCMSRTSGPRIPTFRGRDVTFLAVGFAAYLAWPFGGLNPAYLVLLFAAAVAMSLSTTVSSFKKYL